jgi:uncharacterized RDD family membrane protein YckC
VVCERSDPGEEEVSIKTGNPHDETNRVCPRCDKAGLDDSGACPRCGYGSEENTGADQAGGKVAVFPGAIALDYSGRTEGDAVPAWRQELSKRLQDIKKRREDGMSAGTPPLPFPAPAGQAVQAPLHEIPPEPAKPNAEAQAAAPAAGPVPAPEWRPLRRTPPPKPRAGTEAEKRDQRRQPRPSRSPDAPLFESSRRPAPAGAPTKAAGTDPIPQVGNPDPDKMRQLIDTLVARQAAASPSPASEAVTADSPTREKPPDRLMLLSRSLAGVVDLVIVCACVLSFIFAADFFSGIDTVDAVSVAYYGMLLLAVHYVYSVFFLATSHQTIGMMIRELQVVSADDGRPSVAQVLIRSSAFLLSLFGLGIGLAWGIFDRAAQCLHDRLSGTRVIRA